MTERADQPKQIVSPRSDGALMQHDAGKVINALIRRLGAPMMLGREQASVVRDTLRTTPGLVNEVLVAVYQGVIDQSEHPLTSTLTEIRKNYPGVIRYFQAGRLNPLLDDSPVIGERIAAQKSRMQQNPELAEQLGDIADIEFALRILIEDGSTRNAALRNYHAICMSRDFFEQLALPLIEENYPGMTLAEKDTFTNIGTRLLGVKRVMEMGVPENIKGEIVRHPDRDNDFRGLVRQIGALHAIIECFELVGDPKDRTIIAAYKDSAKKGLDSLIADFQDKLPEIDELFPGTVPALDKLRGWATEYGSFGRRSFRAKDLRPENSQAFPN